MLTDKRYNITFYNSSTNNSIILVISARIVHQPVSTIYCSLYAELCRTTITRQSMTMRQHCDLRKIK